VVRDDVGVVEPVDRVGADDHERLRAELVDQLRVAPQGVGGAAVPAVAALAEPRVQHQQAAVGAVEVPGPAVRQMVGQRDGVELLDHPHVRQPGVQAVAQREVDQPVDAGERHGRLGP
jgi:hypothetical protein